MVTDMKMSNDHIKVPNRYVCHYKTFLRLEEEVGRSVQDDRLLPHSGLVKACYIF